MPGTDSYYSIELYQKSIPEISCDMHVKGGKRVRSEDRTLRIIQLL